jgi:hypothetical protein
MRVEHFNVGTLTVNIYQDEDAESPDTWGDDSIFLLGWHRDFTVTRPNYKRPDDILEYVNEDDCDEDRQIKASIREDYHVFTLYAYIHSGVSLSLGASFGGIDPGGWDTSRLGIVLVSREEWPDEGAARTAAMSLVDTWNQYLSGDVYGYTVTDEDGEQLDSCWGFYGDEDAKGEARSAAEHFAALAEGTYRSDVAAGNLPHVSTDDDTDTSSDD